MKKILVIFVCLLFWGHIDAKEHVIKNIPPMGVVISEPGKYVFENDLTWTPLSDGAAITILASDVTLNMQGHTLQSSFSFFKTIGILAMGSENLKIMHGTIQNMGLSGIQCYECADILIKKIVVDGLNVSDIVNYTVPTGILATGCLRVSIDKCTVKNINVKSGSCAAIQLTETIFSIVKKCQVKNILNQDGACTGIGQLLCDYAEVKSCKVDNLQSQFIDNLNTEGHTAIGLVPVLTTNLKIQNCTISNIIGCCDDAHGISVFLCEEAIVKKTKVSDVVDGLGLSQSGAKATGIEIYASFVKVSDCFVKNITAINPQDKQSTGFACALCLGVEFLRCKAENVSVIDQNGNQNPTLGFGTGFGWAPDPRPEFIFPAVGVLYQECIAKNCQVGFDTFFHIDCIWDHIVSNCNQIPILNEQNSERTLSCDPCSECGCEQAGCFPTPIVVTIDNIAVNNIFLHVKEKCSKE